MKLRTQAATALALICMTGTVTAEQDTYQKVKQKIQNTIGLPVQTVADSPIDGILQISTSQGLFYTSEDGKYLIQGRIFNVEAGMRNETEKELAEIRLDGLKQFENSAIEFKAKDEKFVVNVYTDITCGYCRKLHNDIDQYNDLGITVRYLAFPRAGLKGQSYKDMVSVWCSDDQQQAITLAKEGEQVPSHQCKNDVAAQYSFGQAVGVNGTPNIILPNGSVIPGYQPANLLLQALENI